MIRKGMGMHINEVEEYDYNEGK